ncbi:hypothetical protein SDRG_08026 [Saprolegnia diclina VS20]|uniref:Lipid-binding serum glycoprotein N-terminal domain-containing protein n=1 Tax=Saprolegnia diclina (strain VS20) TaxID=1156394 RepID=T0QLM3_SAPDV|nr:hypothetical protein SDRG_08026 [Saprolegnia diclina VS20]EQC34710.1 hypothetical protein SDRG_08026 [Saprolegnia diclina VS20]|eukprot:XP_008612116.1 hypothetical protein SDRG_08026 [Saprolegnia diclina VS20]
MRLFSLASLVGLCSVVATPTPPVLPLELSTVVQSLKPILSSVADTALPASLGACASGGPEPCMDIGNLFAVKANFYDVKARWVSGLNTVQIDTLQLLVGKNGSMHVDVRVSVDELPISLLIDGCIPKIGCKTFLDNASTCCGGRKTITLGLNATCSETYPYLQNLVLTKATIDGSLNIVMSVLGKSFSVYDATAIAQKKILAGVNKALQDPTKTTLLNSYVRKLYGHKVFCTKEAQTAYLAKQPPRKLLEILTPDEEH